MATTDSYYTRVQSNTPFHSVKGMSPSYPINPISTSFDGPVEQIRTEQVTNAVKSAESYSVLKNSYGALTDIFKLQSSGLSDDEKYYKTRDLLLNLELMISQHLNADKNRTMNIYPPMLSHHYIKDGVLQVDDVEAFPDPFGLRAFGTACVLSQVTIGNGCFSSACNFHMTDIPSLEVVIIKSHCFSSRNHVTPSPLSNTPSRASQDSSKAQKSSFRIINCMKINLVSIGVNSGNNFQHFEIAKCPNLQCVLLGELKNETENQGTTLSAVQSFSITDTPNLQVIALYSPNTLCSFESITLSGLSGLHTLYINSFPSFGGKEDVSAVVKDTTGLFIYDEAPNPEFSLRSRFKKWEFDCLSNSRLFSFLLDDQRERW